MRPRCQIKIQRWINGSLYRMHCRLCTNTCCIRLDNAHDFPNPPMTVVLSLHDICCVVDTEVYTQSLDKVHNYKVFTWTNPQQRTWYPENLSSCKNTHTNNTRKSAILFQPAAKMELDQIAICYVCASPPKALSPQFFAPKQTAVSTSKSHNCFKFLHRSGIPVSLCLLFSFRSTLLSVLCTRNQKIINRVLQRFSVKQNFLFLTSPITENGQ